MDELERQILQKLEEQDKKISEIHAFTQKTNRYFFWTMVLTIVFFVLPLFGLLFAVPYLLSSISSFYSF